MLIEKSKLIVFCFTCWW